MGGNSTTTKENKVENRDPWSGQQPYLLDSFKDASNIYNNQIKTPGYTGDFYAAPTQEMRDAFTNAMNTSTSTAPIDQAVLQAQGLSQAAQNNGQSYLDAGMNLINSQQKYYDKGDQIFNNSGQFLNTSNQLQNIGSGLFNTANGFFGQGSNLINYGQGVVQQGVNGTANAMNGLYNLSQSDLTGKNIENAGRYANNSYMDGMIQSALRDGQRAVTEQILPEINRSAGGTGNYNSSRTGVAEGIVGRGWSDQAADVSSTMRGNAYQQGITASQNDTAAMINALNASGSQGTALSNTGNNTIQAGTGVVNAGTNIANTANSVYGTANDFAKTYLGGLSLANDYYNTGINAAQAGGQLGSVGTGLFNTANQANASVGSLQSAKADINSSNLANLIQSSSVLQGFDQAALDNAQARQEYNDNRPWQLLGNKYGIIGDKSWGGTTTSQGTTTKQENPSIMSSLGSGLGLIGSLFKCDRRVKTDIEMVATLPDGIPLYTFRYIDDPEGVLHTAPMAQDVQKKYPEAVIEIDGVLHIDTNHYDWR
jgi:hypothetical protein